jgi:AraC-like DNA-binding protein
MMRRVIACDRVMLQLIRKLRMARKRHEPAFIDKTTMTLTVPKTFVFHPEIEIGKHFGRFDETITRVSRYRGKHERPIWFRPKEQANHIALHSGYGDAVYFEVGLDKVARENNHPFDVTLVPKVETVAQVMSLFGDM